MDNITLEGRTNVVTSREGDSHRTVNVMVNGDLFQGSFKKMRGNKRSGSKNENDVKKSKAQEKGVLYLKILTEREEEINRQSTGEL